MPDDAVRSESQNPSWLSTSGALVMTTTYDANSNRATVTDQLSRTTTYAYDRLNRLTGIDYSDSGTPDVTYSYDANGAVSLILDHANSPICGTRLRRRRCA